MTARAFLILATITALTVVGALLALLTAPEPARIAEVDRLALPDLADQVEQVAVIDILSADGPVTLQKLPSAGEGTVDAPWTVVQRGDYPADARKVRGLLIRLANLRLAAPKTARPELWNRLEVAPPDAADGAGRLIVLRDAAGTELARLTVGKRRALPTAGEEEGVYLRLDDAPQSWLAAGTLPVDSDPVDWTAREVVHLPGESVRRVEIRPPDGDAVIAEVADPDDVKRLDVLGLPESREADPMEASRLGAALAFVDLQDVRPSGQVPLPDERFQVTVETFDGLEVVAETAEVPGMENQPWAVFVARLSERATDDPDRRAELEAEVAAINARVSGWVYLLSPGVYQRLARRLDDLLVPQGS